MAYNRFTNPDGPMDTTLGLIMRLNRLWDKCDNCAESGKYSEWNFTLDTIWRNLLYRDPLVPVKETNKDGEEVIIDVELSDEDKKLWEILNSRVINSRQLIRISKNPSERNKATYQLYTALQMKDVGLRKFQHKLKLYVKERSKNPSNAMWGG